MITITGGKLTTWRRMAKETVDRIVWRDGSETKCRTHEVPLGMPVAPADLVAAPEAAREQLAGALRAHRPRRAGDAGTLEPIVAGRPDLLAEVAYAARREQARTVGDVLLRRTRLGLTAARPLLGARRRRARRGGAGRRAGVGRSAPRAGGSAFRDEARRRRHPARVVRSAGTFGRRSPVGPERSPSTWSRFATPSDRPADRRLRARSGRVRARGLVPGRRARRPERRRASRSATSTSPATAPARSPTSRTATASRTRSSRASSAARGARRSGSTSPAATATEVKVAAGDGNRLAVAWIADGNVYATVSPGGDTPGGFAPAVALGGPGAQRPRHRPRRQRRRVRDLAGGRQRARRAPAGHDVDARSPRRWTSTPRSRPARARCARRSRSRPRATPSRPGASVAPDGSRACWARRITGHEPLGRPAGPDAPGRGGADSPDIDIEDDGSYAWVVFRQDVGGVSRTLGRRLIGSQFEAPEFIDGGRAVGGPEGRHERRRPRLRRSRRRRRAAQVFGSWLDHDHFQPAGAARRRRQRRRRPSRRSPATDRNDIAIAWRLTGGRRQLGRARPLSRRATPTARWAARSTVSRADLGPVADPGVFDRRRPRRATSRWRWSRAPPGARTLAVAVFDRPPGAPFIESSQAYKRKTRPELRWRPGPRAVGRADLPRLHGRRPDRPDDRTTRSSPATPLTTGKHTWQVEAVDRAGQTTRSRVRTLKIDATPPTLKVSVSGKRAAGAGAEDHASRRRHAAAPGSITSRSTTATSRRRRSSRTTRAPLQARHVHR